MINTSIGKYTITRKIGEGGMASVYEARHEMLGTKVAIKVLNPILSANEQIRERFKNEAKLMASLNHKNITRISDFDEQPNQLSIILEFLEGEDLDEKIKRQGALPDEEILSIFKQAFAAFQYAHEKGIVHRDIKPSNIYILPDGRVKILDFGIAKLFGEGNEMTKTGTQIGTPIYMSPEQVKGDKSIDYRSDIYSLGITLYTAIVGKPPYDAMTESQFEIFNKIVFEPLRGIGIESKYNDIVAKACNKDREQRYQSCEEWLKVMNNLGLASDNSPLKPAAPISEKKVIENLGTNDNEKEPATKSMQRKTKLLYLIGGTAFLLAGFITVMLLMDKKEGPIYNPEKRYSKTEIEGYLCNNISDIIEGAKVDFKEGEISNSECGEKEKYVFIVKDSTIIQIDKLESIEIEESGDENPPTITPSAPKGIMKMTKKEITDMKVGDKVKDTKGEFTTHGFKIVIKDHKVTSKEKAGDAMKGAGEDAEKAMQDAMDAYKL
jgi:serine/threonine protein kinase